MSKANRRHTQFVSALGPETEGQIKVVEHSFQEPMPNSP